MEIKITPNSAYLPSGNPTGVFIDTRATGGQGTDPGPKRAARRGRTAAETRLGPRFRGPLVAARVALRAARGPFCLLSGPVPGFVFAAPGFDKSAPLGQWL